MWLRLMIVPTLDIAFIPIISKVSPLSLLDGTLNITARRAEQVIVVLPSTVVEAVDQWARRKQDHAVDCQWSPTVRGPSSFKRKDK